MVLFALHTDHVLLSLRRNTGSPVRIREARVACGRRVKKTQRGQDRLDRCKRGHCVLMASKPLYLLLCVARGCLLVFMV